jgi:hypothetical protein
VGAGEVIVREVGSWEGVTQAPHRFGGVELRYGRRELGHVHGDALVDLPFQRRLRDMLVETRRAEPHHVLPDSGWVSFRLQGPEDAAEAIELFRLSYERARVAKSVRDARRA